MEIDMQRGFSGRDAESEVRYDILINGEKYSDLWDIHLIDLPETEFEVVEIIKKEEIKDFSLIKYLGHYEYSNEYSDGEYYSTKIFRVDDEVIFNYEKMEKFKKK